MDGEFVRALNIAYQRMQATHCPHCRKELEQVVLALIHAIESGTAR